MNGAASCKYSRLKNFPKVMVPAREDGSTYQYWCILRGWICLSERGGGQSTHLESQACPTSTATNSSPPSNPLLLY